MNLRFQVILPLMWQDTPFLPTGPGVPGLRVPLQGLSPEGRVGVDLGEAGTLLTALSA